MEAQVELNEKTKLYELVIELEGTRTVISSSKNYGHWQYHCNRGTLSKTLTKYGIKSFVYVGFTPNEQKPEPIPMLSDTPNMGMPAESWFLKTFSNTPETRKRGRPRKAKAPPKGIIVHKMSDEEPPLRILSNRDTREIHQAFQVIQKAGKTTKESLEYVAKQFFIPYRQAYDVVLEIL